MQWRNMNTQNEGLRQVEMSNRCIEYLGSESSEEVINILCLIQKNMLMAYEVAMNYFFRTGDEMFYYIANGDSFSEMANRAKASAAM